MRDDGWFEYYSIENPNVLTCGKMICSECGKEIKNEDYIIMNRQNIYHRGNETDEIYLYHIGCKQTEEVTNLLREKRQEDQKRKDFEKNKDKAIEDIKKLIEMWDICDDDIFI